MKETQVAENGAGARQKNLTIQQGVMIANAAHRSIGMSTSNPRQVPQRCPQYALAVSRIFTMATNQKLMTGKDPDHVLSTAHLWRSLMKDKRFEQVALSDAVQGDIVIATDPSKADGYAGIVVDHGRVVSNSYKGVRDDTSLAEIQRSAGIATFRHVGVWDLARSKPFTNAGFDPAEARIPVGQPGGGQWTMAPSKIVLTGGNGVLPDELPIRASATVPSKKAPVVVPGVPADADTFTYNGQVIHIPPNADFEKVYNAGVANGRLNIAGIKAAVGHYGTFDYQRNQGHGEQSSGVNNFYPAYTDASNFAVGAFMAGAGFSREETERIASHLQF